MTRCPRSVVIVGVVVILAAAIGFAVGRSGKDPNAESRQVARVLVDRALMVRHWEGIEGSSSVPDFRFVVEELSDSFQHQESRVRFIVPNAKQAEEQPHDSFEESLLSRFKGVDEKSQPQFAERSSAKAYRYYEPVHAKATCVKICHHTFTDSKADSLGSPAKDGQLMAIVEITIPRETQHPE